MAVLEHVRPREGIMPWAGDRLAQEGLGIAD